MNRWVNPNTILNWGIFSVEKQLTKFASDIVDVVTRGKIVNIDIVKSRISQ